MNDDLIVAGILASAEHRNRQLYMVKKTLSLQCNFEILKHTEIHIDKIYILF